MESIKNCFEAAFKGFDEIKSPGRSAFLPGHRFGAKAGFQAAATHLVNLSG